MHHQQNVVVVVVVLGTQLTDFSTFVYVAAFGLSLGRASPRLLVMLVVMLVVVVVAVAVMVAMVTFARNPFSQPKHDSHSDAILEFTGDFECLSNTYRCPVSLRGDAEPYPSVEVRAAWLVKLLLMFDFHRETTVYSNGKRPFTRSVQQLLALLLSVASFLSPVRSMYCSTVSVLRTSKYNTTVVIRKEGNPVLLWLT